eukprot:superscaffoldBa00002064_g13052
MSAVGSARSGSAAGPVQQGLKEALIETLTAILSPVQEVRAAAEEQIKVLEVTEEFGVHLAELTVDPQGALAIRQLASVILKQYVETHWCSQSEKFRPPETTDQAKAAIRELLPGGLREAISKVRSSVAYAVSAIAHWDWPEAWPQLFTLLMEMLVYSIRTRSRAVEIFTTCANLICAIEELEKGAAKALIFPVVQQFTEAFVQALQMPDGPSSDSGLKMEVLKAVATEFQNESAAALAAAATRHLQEAEQAKNSSNEHWWKVHEACMLALGSVKTIITENVKNGRIQFDMHGFLASVILADLNLAAASPFLLGRALWAASRFTAAMSPELIQQFLQATVSGLHDSQPPSVRISAVRAIWGYCDQLKLSESTHVLQPFLPSILEGLVQLAAQFSSEVLTLVMETLCIVCTVDPAFTTSAENKICPLTIAIFLKYNNDPVVASLAQDIFKELAQIEGCQGPMQMRLIPTLVSIMQAPPDKIPSGLCALDQILRAILSKMQQAETLSVMQSLIMVFAHLVHSQLEPLLEFLCSLPGPTGKPALEFVMTEWMSRQHLFYGQYEGKVSTVALCKLLQHSLNTDDKRLQDIVVKGEEIYSPEDGIRTRSKSAKNPERWTNIPLLVKIFKLIINELSTVVEANASRVNAADWSQDDDYYEDDEEDDPDALKDPIYLIDLQAYLTDFLTQFAQQPCYSMFSGHLNNAERQTLQSIGL